MCVFCVYVQRIEETKEIWFGNSVKLVTDNDEYLCCSRREVNIGLVFQDNFQKCSKTRANSANSYTKYASERDFSIFTMEFRVFGPG